MTLLAFQTQWAILATFGALCLAFEIGASRFQTFSCAEMAPSSFTLQMHFGPSLESHEDVNVPFDITAMALQPTGKEIISAKNTLRPQFRTLCASQQFKFTGKWGIDECTSDLDSQFETAIIGICGREHTRPGFPKHQAHGQTPGPEELSHCREIMVFAYVPIGGYRSRDVYLSAAVSLIPRQLDFNRGKRCAVLFSDDKDFLDVVKSAVEAFQDILLNRGQPPLGVFLTQLLYSPLPVELKSSLANAVVYVPRNAAIALQNIPTHLNLKDGTELQPGVGRLLAAAAWFQKLDFCVLAADLVPSADDLQWHDLSERTSITLEIYSQIPNVLWAVTYPPSRPISSLNYGGEAPCAAWAHGSFLAMRSADALNHSNNFYSALVELSATGQNFLDEEIVLAYAANARGCNQNGRLEAKMDLRDICSHPAIVCEASSDWNG